MTAIEGTDGDELRRRRRDVREPAARGADLGGAANVEVDGGGSRSSPHGRSSSRDWSCSSWSRSMSTPRSSSRRSRSSWRASRSHCSWRSPRSSSRRSSRGSGRSGGCRGTRTSTGSRASTSRSSAGRRCCSRSCSSTWRCHRPGSCCRPSRPRSSRSASTTASYMTEVFRSGIEAVPHGQTEAAQSLGMTSRTTFRRIIAPQAFRIVTPAVGNDFVAMIKDSSLASVVGVQEILWRAQTAGRPTLPVDADVARRGVHLLGPDDPVLAVPGPARAADGDRRSDQGDGHERREAVRVEARHRPGRGGRACTSSPAPSRSSRRPRSRRTSTTTTSCVGCSMTVYPGETVDDPWAVGVGQEHVPAVPEFPRGADGRGGRHRRGGRRGRPASPAPRPRDRGPDPAAAAAGRDAVPGVQPLPASVGAREPHRGAGPREGDGQERGDRAGRDVPGEGRAEREA